MNPRRMWTATRIPRLVAIMMVAGVTAMLSGAHHAMSVSAHHDDRPSPKLHLDCPQTHVEEGDAIQVYLVRTDLNGHEGYNFGAYWHTSAFTANGFDYHHRGRVWQSSSGAQRRHNRMAYTIRTYEDTRLEGEETFTVSFTPLDNVKNHDDPRLDNRCEIAIVDDEARVTGIDIISRPAAGTTYGRKETIEFAVTFSREVEVKGRPIMGIWVSPRWRAARYERGSGTDTLVFGYTVRDGDRDGNGVSVHNGYHDGKRWHGFGLSSVINVKDTDIGVSRIYRGIGNQSGHRADSSILRDAVGLQIVSTPANGVAYGVGEDIEIEIRYQEAVSVTGRKGIAIRVGDHGSGRPTYRAARYVRGSSSDRIVYGYTVRSGERDDTGISVDRGGRNSGYTRDGRLHFQSSGDEVSVYYPALGADPDQKVYARDTTGPTVSSVAFTSDPGDDDTYAVGDDVAVTVTFSEDIEVTGSPQIELNVGGAAKYATFDRVTGQAVVFAYTVAAGDSDADGIAIGANKIRPNGGTLADASGNPAVLTHDAVAADAGQMIDGVSPEFVSATTTTIAARRATLFTPATPERPGIVVTLSESTDPNHFVGWLATHPDVEIQHFFDDIAAVTVDGVSAQATGLSVSGNTFTIPLQHAITAGQDVKVSYDNNFARDSQGLFADSAGNPVTLFSNRPVTNLSTESETTAESDADGIVFGVAEVNVAEGSTANYSVSLATRPDANVTVAISIDPAGNHLTASAASLAFTRDNWSNPQRVTLTAAEDTNASKFWAVVNHSAAGGRYDDETRELRVVVEDND